MKNKRKMALLYLAVALISMVILSITLIGILYDKKIEEGFNTDLPEGKTPEMTSKMEGDHEKEAKDSTSTEKKDTVVKPKKKRLCVKKPVKPTDTIVKKPLQRTDTVVKKQRKFLSVENTVSKSTFSGSILQNQKIKEGGRVRIRLNETMEINGRKIPAGTCLTGTAHYEKERIGITVSSVNIQGEILCTSIKVFDTDGLEGLYKAENSEKKSAKSVASTLVDKMVQNSDMTSLVGPIWDGSKNYLSDRQFMVKRERKVLLQVIREE